MNAITSLNESLREERAELARSAHLRWFHWLILGLSLVLTLAAWRFSSNQVEVRTRAVFDQESAQVVDLVRERMQKYEDALWSGVAAINTLGGEIGYNDWKTFSSSLTIDRKYPGINGIGVIQWVPEGEMTEWQVGVRRTRPEFTVYPVHDRAEKLPIVYIEPVAMNREAVGLDIAHEQNRFDAAMNARLTGTAQITGPIVLVQDEGHTPGFLFYAPYYEGQAPQGAGAPRLDAFRGLVYAPFVVNKLIAGTLDQSRRQVGIRLSDGESILYDENTEAEPGYDADPLYRKSLQVALYGRTWRFDIRSTLGFRTMNEDDTPTMILAGGIAIDLLLLTLFVALSRASRGTLDYADRLTAELRSKAGELARSNGELESFAYIASHDLKTPVRGIADLTEYVLEDLDDCDSRPDAIQDVRRNVGRIRQQTDRMISLIRGIMEYSSVGKVHEDVAELVLPDLVAELRSDLEVDDKQLVLEGDVETVSTFKTRLRQSLTNLVENAFKYHHDRDNARVVLRAELHADYYRFSVADNGPGIDPKFHQRIFEVFQTLQSRDKIEGSGVGLSIVKKSVETLGGEVRVSSKPGSGTVFEIDWPIGLQSRGNVKSMGA